MIKVFLVFFAVGLLASLKSRESLRAYNRRMFPSMQRRPAHLWPLLWFTVLGLASAAATRYLDIHP